MRYKIQDVKYNLGNNSISRDLIGKILAEMKTLSEEIPPLGNWMHPLEMIREIKIDSRAGEKNFYTIRDIQRKGSPPGTSDKTRSYLFENNSLKEI
jgi:hypothetical protein